jgi:hypothetical protein
MTKSESPQVSKLEQGRELARRLFDRKLAELEKLSSDERSRLHTEYNLLTQAEFDDVLQQVIQAKVKQQQLVGWQAIPHDLTILMAVIVYAISGSLQAGVITWIGVLILTENVFPIYFNANLYKPLSFLVWLTYPAYLLLAYLMYRDGYAIQWILVGVAAVWGGTFIAGIIARLPIQLILRGKQAGAVRPPDQKS